MAGNALRRQYGVLHLIGRDRVGLLQDATTFVSEHGAVTEEGISHTLHTEAVVLLLISGIPHQLELIEHEAPRLGESLGVLALFTRIREPNSDEQREALPLTLRVSSPDFNGLLATMTRLFTRHQTRIVAHHAHKADMPFSQGGVAYRQKFTVLLPTQFNRKQFLAELEQLSREQNFMRDDISHSDYF